MPKLEPKDIQKELEKGVIWPVYWLYGQERMKVSELLKRIRKTVLGDAVDAGAFSFGEEVLDGTEVPASAVVDSAQSLSLGGGIRFVVVREAHALKESEQLSVLLGPSLPKNQIQSVCVFLSKDLDGRKKFSKLLIEKAAVVPCEEVPEEDREAWIGYLAKRRGLELPAELVVQLRSLDPWTLDIVDQELAKFSISQDPAVVLGSLGEQTGSDEFLEAFLGRRLTESLKAVESFAESPEISLPLLGLLSWNVRYLALVIADREKGTRTVKLSPFLAERFSRWGRKWSQAEVVKLQNRLAELDFGIKQTARLPLGLWSSLVMEFCRGKL